MARYTLIHFAVAFVLSSTAVAASAQKVNVWLTTDTQKSKLAQQPATSFAATSTAAPVIYVDEAQTYQTVEGFGASFTDSAAYLLKEKVPAAQLSTVMNNLFSRTSGIGLSFVRNPMGASDITRSVYSYDDLPAGSTDASLAKFSIAHDMTDIVPLLKQAKQINPKLKIMANPWSPPGWMKTTHSMIGGSLQSQYRSAYANYFVKFIKAYAAQGITIDYISMQNEPLYVPGDYPGMCMPALTSDISHCGLAQTDETTQIKATLTALKTAGLTTKVLIYDHNWDGSDYPRTALSDATIKASPQVAGIAWHGYGGPVGAMSLLHNLYPGFGNYETEHSGGTWVSDQVRQDFEEITHVMRSWGKSYVKWSLALNQSLGPHTGGCGTCTPLVTVNSTTGAVSYPIEYYTMGQFSKFVQPGGTRVYSNNAAGFVSVAFKNPDASKVLVVFNENNVPASFQVVWNKQKFTYVLPGFSGATFVWSGSQASSYAIPATQAIQVSSYNDEYGLETETCNDVNGGYDAGYIDAGDWARFRSVDFGTGAVSKVSVRTASGGSGGSVEFRLDSRTGTLISTVTLPVTGGWQTWKTVTGNVSKVTGQHDVYIVFKGGSGGIANLNWFQFK